MATKGRIVYVPPIIIDEVDDIIREDELTTRADGFKELTKYARVGREANRLMKLDFTKKIRQKPVDIYFPGDILSLPKAKKRRK